MPERIGDLVVLADKATLFGDLARPDEELAPGYRNHGSLYEEDIPLIIYGADGPLPLPQEVLLNFDLTRWLCQTIL
jgi:phosphonoacetate hydrolase